MRPEAPPGVDIPDWEEAAERSPGVNHADSGGGAGAGGRPGSSE